MLVWINLSAVCMNTADLSLSCSEHLNTQAWSWWLPEALMKLRRETAVGKHDEECIL
jgi:hypothetical protein